jgi:hypothetical protein
VVAAIAAAATVVGAGAPADELTTTGAAGDGAAEASADVSLEAASDCWSIAAAAIEASAAVGAPEGVASGAADTVAAGAVVWDDEPAGICGAACAWAVCGDAGGAAIALDGAAGVAGCGVPGLGEVAAVASAGAVAAGVELAALTVEGAAA